MQEADITATFGPVHGDAATLSTASSRTLAAIYQHPLSHTLEWSDIVALFEKLGTVDRKHHAEIMFTIAGEHHLARKPHGKDATNDDVLAFRHMLTKAGWAPSGKPELEREPAVASPAPVVLEHPDLLAVVTHHEARIFQLDVSAADLAAHVIRPHDPHHFLHHLTHKDESRERGQRAPEDDGFHERVAQALVSAGRVVLLGHGNGHSNAARHLADYLRAHHHDTFLKIVSDALISDPGADVQALTAPQLLALGRRALTA